MDSLQSIRKRQAAQLKKMGQKLDQVTTVSIQTDTDYEKVFKTSGHQEMHVGTTWGIHRRERSVGGWEVGQQRTREVLGPSPGTGAPGAVGPGAVRSVCPRVCTARLSVACHPDCLPTSASGREGGRASQMPQQIAGMIDNPV